MAAVTAARGALAALALFFQLGPAAAQPDSAEAAIRNALTNWTRQFNAGEADKICELFAPELRYDYRGQPERGFDDVCALLRRALGDRTKTYSYALHIKEIIVSGDLAVVRLVWTFGVRPAGSAEAVTSIETGLDVFRKQPDGRWTIIRYIAYD